MADTRQPNPAQAHAINQIDSNIAVTAGAGSGKTTVLVGRYLNLLASGRRVGELVAITFTRKAAAEMSARLREALEKRLSETTDPDLRRRFTVALQDMNAARISTIHSLCGDIVRANAAQCGIDPSFTVLDEVQGRVMFSAARERVLRTLGADPDDSAGAQAARGVVRAYGLNNVRSALKVELLAQAAEDAAAPLTADELLESWRAVWLEVAVAGCADLAAFVEQELTGFAVPADDKLTEHVVSARQALDLLRSASPSHLMAGLGQVMSVKINVGSAKNWVSVDVKTVKEALAAARERAKKLTEVLGGDIDSEINREAVGHLVGWREIARRVVEAYRDAKRRQNALDFNDLEALAGRVLADDAVAARYQTQFKQVMVDEFQDTSVAQWAIIRRLAPPDQPGRLFIVGDPKQSIYGFRGSDHTVFTQATEGIRASGLLQSPIVNTAVALDTSYRTHAPLLSSLNTLFAGVMTVPVGSDGAGYVPFEPLHPGREGVKGAAPFLRVRRFDENQDPLPGVEKWSADSVRQQEAADLAEQVESLVAAGFPYGEMAVLLRAGTNFYIYEDALRARGIPYITNAGRGYFNRREVADLLNLMRALYADGDNLALAAALRSPLFGLSDAALYSLRALGGSLWSVVTADTLPADFPADETDALAFARRTLLALHPRARRARIADVLREAIERTGYAVTLEGLPAGAQARANLQKLVDLAEQVGVVTLNQFLTYIEQVKTAEARESDAALDAENAVQLMTIHASKGLEFGVVFLPDCNDHKNITTDVLTFHPRLGLVCKSATKEKDAPTPFGYKHAQTLQTAREEAEALRLFYVAATRAKDVLVMSGRYRVNKGGETSASGRLGHLLGLESALMGAHAGDVVYEDIAARPLARTPRMVSGGRGLPSVEPDPTAAPPLLMQPIPSAKFVPSKHITTTDLSHLSQSRHAPDPHQRRLAKRRFRRGVLGQSDAPIRFLTAGSLSDRAPSRVVGEVVHEAVRFGYETEPDDALRRLLRSLVWSQPLAPTLHADAVDRAFMLIQRYRQSTLYHEVQKAEAVYREIPFVYHLNRSIIHGQIDLVFRSAAGRWTLVDYKTDYVGSPRLTLNEADFRRHSERHLTQLAVYARAVRERLGLSDLNKLAVNLHYIAHHYTLVLSPDALEQALTNDNLPSLVEQALGDADA